MSDVVRIWGAMRAGISKEPYLPASDLASNPHISPQPAGRPGLRGTRAVTQDDLSS
jgi:hypothetical protein